jgi:DNA (cytosine-5)-methyltransferase 1
MTDVAAPKLVELFCGGGGFSRGAHNAGFEVSAAYDIDPILSSSYPLNFPNTQLFHRDVGPLTGAEIVRDIGQKPFGIFGGPPCQGFSDIGKRDTADPRRKLLGHFFRVVSEAKPTFFVMENVRGLAYADSRPVLDDALEYVNGTYDILGPHIWDSSQFGAPTKRNRMFVIGVHKDRAAPLTLPDVERHKTKPPSVRQAIADLASAHPIESSDDLPGFDRWQIRRRGQPSDYAWMLRSVDNIFTGHRATAHTKAVVERFGKVKPGKMDPVGRHPRLKWNGLCPTLRAGTGSDLGSYQSVRPIHPSEDRVITVREAARLQGFPDRHVFHPTVWHSFRMIGNSVSPFMAEAIFLAVRGRLGLPMPGEADDATGVEADEDEAFDELLEAAE